MIVMRSGDGSDLRGLVKLGGPTEVCRCPGRPPLKLMSALVDNPFHCLDCNLEVDPAGFALSPSQIDALVAWRSIYDAIDRLWLDSGPYEQWAYDQLADIRSPLNVRGRSLQRELSPLRRTYYWWFQDESGDDFQPATTCPVCARPFTVYPTGIFTQHVCEACRIVTAG